MYRLWACIRAAGLRSWLRAAGVLPPPGPGCAADWQAYDLAMDLAVARAEEVGIAGLAVDWSKCYDRLRLSVLK